MKSRFEKFSYLIGELSKLLHKIEGDVLEEIGLKGPHAIYFLTIAKHSEGITASELSEICGRDKADVSRTVTALVNGGFAEKITEDGKKYKSTFKLTQKGLNVAKDLRSKADSAVEYASRGVSAEDRAVFYSTLETIYSNMKKISDFGVLQNTD